MIKLKLVKCEDSLAIKVPKGANFHLKDLWLAIPKSKNNYTLVPKIFNPFANAKDGEFYSPEEWPNINTSNVD